MMVWAFNASVEQSRRILNIDHLPFLSKFYLQFFSFLNKCAFRGVEGRMGGKSANIIAMVLGYLSNLFCLFGFASTAVLCFVYYVFDRLCSQITDFSDSSCLDFTVYEPLLNKPLKLCGGDLQQFCVLSSTAYIWYIVGFIGCLITILGLQHFLMCSAANYSRVSFGMRAEELKEV
uniref:Transmembrane protein n=1 Tax=Syphacia muris TaxID=451379 RepID=A0A0N5AR20_9BILA